MSLSVGEYTCGGTIAARGLKRQKFLLKAAVYFIHIQSHGHEIAPQLIRHFHLDELINRRIKLVRRRILTTPAAKDYLEAHRCYSYLYTKSTNLESRAVSKCVCTRQSA
jgi:hypothetical protein